MAAPVLCVDIRLLDEPVGYEALPSFPSAAGGECVFLGRTRRERHARHGELRTLVYEAYQPLAVQVLRAMADEAVTRWGCLAVRIHHTVGEVPLGEASVLVQVACPHRDHAFAACRFLIDELKSRAPIWKREQWQDGSTWSRGSPVAVEEASS